MSSLHALLLTQAGVSGMLAGLIWFVQVVHYPLFDGVGGDGFRVYAGRHRGRTTRVVAPLMFVELACALWLSPIISAGVEPALAWTGLVLVGAVWGVTFFVSVPLHARLDRGFDARAHRALVLTNWIRTALWSARMIVALTMMEGAMVSAAPALGS